MRLIDADLAVAKCNEDIEAVKDISQRVDGILDAIMNIHECPTIDAVPVVRCKDCKEYYLPFNHMQVEQLWTCMRYGLLRNADDFCSRGERRQG